MVKLKGPVVVGLRCAGASGLKDTWDIKLTLSRQYLHYGIPVCATEVIPVAPAKAFNPLFSLPRFKQFLCARG